MQLNVIQGFPSSQIAPNEIAHYSATDLLSLSPDQIQALSATQLAALSSLLCEQFSALRQQCAWAFGAFDHLANVILICDGVGTIKFANRAAEQLLTAADGLSAQENVVQSKPLVALLARACARGNAVETGGVLIAREPPKPPLQVMVAPLAAGDPRFLPWQQRLAVVMVQKIDGVPDGIPMMTQLYRFTPAEARLAERLAQGTTPAECAEQLQISITTVRWHVRSLLEKTGVRRLAELMRLLASFQPLYPA